MTKKEKTLTFRTKQFTIICNHNARSGNCIIKKGSKVYNVTGKMPIRVWSCVAYMGCEEIDLNHLVKKQNTFAVLVRAEAEMKRIIKKKEGKARLMCVLSKTRNLIYATLIKGVLTIHSVRLVNGKVQRHCQHIQFGKKGRI